MCVVNGCKGLHWSFDRLFCPYHRQMWKKLCFETGLDSIAEELTFNERMRVRIINNALELFKNEIHSENRIL